MKDRYDPWYVRLPDGRTVKAKSTASVRHHVEAGQIPFNSLVRRDANEEWVALVWVAEFADLARGASPTTLTSTGPAAAPRSGVAARLDPLRLQTVGVRGLIDELIAALDTTLTRSKMGPAFVAAIALFLGPYAVQALVNWLLAPPAWMPIAAAAAFAIVVVAVLNAVLAKLTHQELATMRPVPLRHATRSLRAYLIPVLIANLLVAGTALVLIYFVHRLPDLVSQELIEPRGADTVSTVTYTAVLVLVYLLSAFLWITIGLCWLLTPAIVVEESSWLAGLREWRQLLRENFGRVVIYEGLALMLGLAISLPLILATGLALYAGPAPESDDVGWVIAPVQRVQHGFAIAPLLALLPVANVFIYLNLRYEQAPGR